MAYSDTLAKLRKDKGYTQADVAAFLSERSARTYTFKNISHWETGVSLPPIEQFLLLCELYGARDIQETFRGLRTELREMALLNPLGVSRAREYIAMLSQTPLFARFETRTDSEAVSETLSQAGDVSCGKVGFESEVLSQAGYPSRMEADYESEALSFTSEGLSDSGEFALSRSDTFAPAPAPQRFIRLYDIPAAAGYGSFLDSDAYEDFEVDKTVPTEADYAVRVSGDSMTPRFVDGQIAFVKEQRSLDVGDIGVFGLDGDAYIKRLGHGELISLNKLYKPIQIQDFQSFHIFGKVVG